jgi:hypothetical protein
MSFCKHPQIVTLREGKHLSLSTMQLNVMSGVQLEAFQIVVVIKSTGPMCAIRLIRKVAANP